MPYFDYFRNWVHYNAKPVTTTCQNCCKFIQEGRKHDIEWDVCSGWARAETTPEQLVLRPSSPFIKETMFDSYQ
ncbi:hypothetical protein Y032_0232g3056 [Ancylostoma ceylanicum]|uniref:Uncharacterized protein n=1 Tax=Ancylostoma ceylanicum TaxID=53326 RepID=A0A016SGC8_9BILA|nr:hypothetical protein Y032_0232g3056 [Ancylostoma ceylanicum]